MARTFVQNLSDAIPISETRDVCCWMTLLLELVCRAGAHPARTTMTPGHVGLSATLKAARAGHTGHKQSVSKCRVSAGIRPAFTFDLKTYAVASTARAVRTDSGDSCTVNGRNREWQDFRLSGDTRFGARHACSVATCPAVSKDCGSWCLASPSRAFNRLLTQLSFCCARPSFAVPSRSYHVLLDGVL
jgi:hypothetical protein